jgi:hypothetical protein
MELYLFVYSDLNGYNGVVMCGIEKHKKNKYCIILWWHDNQLYDFGILCMLYTCIENLNGVHKKKYWKLQCM